MKFIHIATFITFLLCGVHQAMSGSVKAITKNIEAIVNTTVELSWRVETNKAGEVLFGVQLYEAGVVVIDDKSGTVTEAGKNKFGGRLSAHFSNGVFKMFIKKIQYNEAKSFTLLAVFNTASGVTRINDTATITNVKGGPLFCGAHISKSYNVAEGKALTLKQDVCGNPQPNVQWKMSSDSTYIPSKSSVLKENITRTYQYTYTTKVLHRTNCGHIIEFRASGHKPDITEQTMININFKPSVPTAIAYYHQDNCVHLNWKTEDTGNCKVTYQLTFNTGKTFEVTGNTFKNCSQELLRTTSVNIRGIYNNQRGDKSEDVFSSTRPPNPPKKDDGNNKGLIIGVVVSVIIIIIIIIVIVVCVLKRRKNDESNYPLRYEEPEENDYVMDLNMPKTNAQPSSNEDRKNNPDQVIYSDVGMGGGRTGPKPVVAPAIYSEMKVDSRGYPVDGNNPSREKGVYSAVGPNSHSDSDSDADHYAGVVV